MKIAVRYGAKVPSSSHTLPPPPNTLLSRPKNRSRTAPAPFQHPHAERWDLRVERLKGHVRSIYQQYTSKDPCFNAQTLLCWDALMFKSSSASTAGTTEYFECSDGCSDKGPNAPKRQHHRFAMLACSEVPAKSTP